MTITNAPLNKDQTMRVQNDSLGEMDGLNGTENITMPIHFRDEELAKMEIIVQSVCFALTIFNNACVLVALLLRRKKVSRMQLFILHLSIADLIVAFFNTLPQIIWDITYRFLAGDSMCRFIKYTQMFSLYLSTYILIMTAIDRYRAICHPLTNQTWTPFMVYSMIFSAYFIAAVFSIPQAILFRIQETNAGNGEYDCWVHFEPSWGLEAYTLYVLCALYLIPLFILIVTYSAICYTIWSKYRASRESNNERIYNQEVKYSATKRKAEVQLRTNQRSRNRGVLLRTHSVRGFSRAKLKTIKLTFTVILAYIICWSPFFVSQIWWLYDETATTKNEALVLILLLANLNSCTNPWIYLAFNRNIFRNLIPFKRCTSKKKRTTNHGMELKSLKTTRNEPINSIGTRCSILQEQK